MVDGADVEDTAGRLIFFKVEMRSDEISDKLTCVGADDVVVAG